MQNKVKVDVAIFGGGVSGLWLLNRLRQKNYSVILLESDALGAGQTIKSQGIIHGGMKYALQGSMTAAARAIAACPHIWEKCLIGEGEIDLRDVTILSKQQYLWTTGALSSKIAGFFASLSLKGHVQALKSAAFPAIFKVSQFKGRVYSLDEMVIDIASLIHALAKPYQDNIFKINSLPNLQFAAAEELSSITVDGLEIQAKKYIFAAGNGNELFLQQLNTKEIAMQQRPLHMVIVKHDFPYELYAHCVGLNNVPRVTMTTHRREDGKMVWYVGGQIAEEGAKRKGTEQIKAAQKELAELFPWLNFNEAEFSSFMVNRAEALQADGKRPDSCYVNNIGNMLIVWPTKLAFAPLLADQVIDNLLQENLSVDSADVDALKNFPHPLLSEPVWTA